MLKETCSICGDQLEETENFHTATCYYCKTENQVNKTCIHGHYICPNCANKPVNEKIFAFCLETSLSDPNEIVMQAFDQLGVPIHGPEHHFLIPAALTTAYLNFTHQDDKKEEFLTEIKRRSEMILGGFCWTHGTCGAAIAVGTFISIITQTHWLSEKEWQLSNLATARTLEAIAKAGGPRCCKRDTFIALRIARDFLEELFQIKLPLNTNIVCHFHDLNKECTQNRCMFHFSNYEK
ncbi:MAG TPA: DUF5714 domain-containing protein [Bacteroidales bacterium]|jgi:hypothetical protein|nr:DUF5714 domain-containing protein [Bacteroidales bacterium]HQQ01500.1 DUF5714 domain-containing protein [Bacteroidales bacterium]